MRRLLAFAVVLGVSAACGGGSADRSNATQTRGASASPARGPDALILRVPRSGGTPRVAAYPAIDSTVWTASDAAPAIERVLAFDADAGLIAAVDTREHPFWIDLRVGSVTVPTRAKLHGLTSVDGSTIYGVGGDGAVARFTPSGNWVFRPPQPARAVFPQSNGTLLILGGTGEHTRVWRIRPPENRIRDSITIANAVTGLGAPLGERVYFTTSSGTLVGVRARTMRLGKPLTLDHTVRAIAATPSGDRFYVVTDSSSTLYVIDTFQDRIEGRADLPGPARDLRVDPFGRYVLIRSAKADSVWVLAIGTNQIVGRFASAWRPDAPFVLIDGAIARVERRDLVIDGNATRRVSGGAGDFWYPFAWNGLRPRAAALDQPVRLPSDSDTTAKPLTAPETAAAHPPPPPPQRIDSTKLGFTVSFAALLDEARAREAASKITINGQSARVVTGMTAGTAVYHVVLGPYSTREEADRVGRASGQSYVIIVGPP